MGFDRYRIKCNAQAENAQAGKKLPHKDCANEPVTTHLAIDSTSPYAHGGGQLAGPAGDDGRSVKN